VYKDDSVLDRVATVFTIHNLSYQGMFDHNNVSELDLDDGRSDVANFFDKRLLKQNFMRRGIMHADVISTVSPTYAREIMRPEYGEKLDKLLTEVRSKLSGILNGIDVDEFNPATDKLIEKNFDIYSIEKRVHNKLALQKEFDLDIDENIPIFGYVGRMEGYKGLDLVSQVLPPLMRDFNCQFVAIGGGSGHITGQLRELQKQYPGKIGGHYMLDFTLPRLLFAGVDVIMVPSRFEPCGLPQMEGARYGAIPLVHNTGGLSDSVDEYKPEIDEGFGFKFRNYDAYALFGQMVRALEAYRNKNTWKTLQRRAMMQDNSWNARAVDYNKLYEKADQLHRKALSEEGKVSTIKPLM